MLRPEYAVSNKNMFVKIDQGNLACRKLVRGVFKQYPQCYICKAKEVLPGNLNSVHRQLLQQIKFPTNHCIFIIVEQFVFTTITWSYLLLQQCLHLDIHENLCHH